MRKRDLERLVAGAALNKPRTEYVTKTIHEHRAPTDDSIRLAREYEEKAWEAIERRVLHDIPSIEATAVIAEESFADRATHVFFKVNGRPVRVRYDKLSPPTHQSLLEDLAREITSEVIALLLSGPAAKVIQPQYGREER